MNKIANGTIVDRTTSPTIKFSSFGFANNSTSSLSTAVENLLESMKLPSIAHVACGWLQAQNQGVLLFLAYRYAVSDGQYGGAILMRYDGKILGYRLYNGVLTENLLHTVQ